jgi:SAM-dependent methyltransferase
METRPGYDGSGPGDITPDGCAVDLYLRLPVAGEPEVIAAAVPPPATLLELGCGVGRVSRPLSTLGYDVTAVDESAEMLRHVTGARAVRSSIEQLDLGETFDVVLLSSFLVHAGDPAVRRALLDTCVRHVDEGGVVLIQREGADWHTRVPRERPLLDGVSRITASTDAGDGVRSVHAEYVFPDARWTQTFLSRPLTPEQFEQALTEAGLRLERYLTDDGTWAAARLSPSYRS